MLGGGIHLADQFVDQSQRFLGRQFDLQPLEADDVGEDHRHLVVLHRDGVFALLEPLGDGVRHQGAQQLIGVLAVLVDQVLLDGEAAAHLVEGHREIPDLVTGLDGNRDVVVTGTDPLRTLLEPPDRTDEHLRQQDRQQADPEDHAGGHQHDGLGERRLLDEGLGGVDLGDDRPMQVGVPDRHRREGLQGVVAQIVGGDHGAGFTLQRRAAGRRRQRLYQRRSTLPDGHVGDVRWGARRHDGLLVPLRILEEQPGIRPHQLIRAAQDGLARLAEPGLLPLLVEGHQPVDLRDRELQRQNTFRSAVPAQRGHHPRGRSVLGRLVELEVGEAHIIDRVRRHRLGEGRLEFGSRVGTRHDVGAEIDTLVGVEDHIAGRVDQQRVLKLEAGHDLAEEILVLGVGRRPLAAVAGVGHGYRVVVVLAQCGVVGLQVALGVGTRQQRRGVQCRSAVPLGLLDERVVVVVDDVLPLGRVDGGVGQLVEAGAEGLQGIPGDRPVGVDDYRVLQIGDLTAQRPGLRFAQFGQPVEHRVP